MLTLAAILMLGIGVVAKDACDGVAFLPRELVKTGAKDVAQSGDEHTNNELVDVHTYNHFYTFQVDRQVNKVNEGIEMLIPAEKFVASSADGFAFRLRAEFNSAEGSRAEVGFRLKLLVGRNDDDTDDKREVLADVSSLDSDYGEGTVMIDLPKLYAGKDYSLRYEFF